MPVHNHSPPRVGTRCCNYYIKRNSYADYVIHLYSVEHIACLYGISKKRLIRALPIAKVMLALEG